MKTRQKLIEFLKNQIDGNDYSQSGPDDCFFELTDALIKEGWVQLDEPKEFWIYRKRNHCKICQNKWTYLASDEPLESTPLVDSIIHVKEVIE